MTGKVWKEEKARFVVCVDNTGYPASLELHKIYRVLPDEDAEADSDLRVVDGSGEDYLYPDSDFMLLTQQGQRHEPQEGSPH